LTPWAHEVLASGVSLQDISFRLAVNLQSYNMWSISSREGKIGGARVVVVHKCTEPAAKIQAMQGALFLQIPATADSYIRSGSEHENSNHGTSPVLFVRENDEDGSLKYVSFVRWKLPAQLQNADKLMYSEIKLVKLRSTSQEELASIKVRMILDDWEEGQVSMSNRPKSSFQVMFCKVRHVYNADSETFVIDTTEELREMIHKKIGFFSVEIFKESHPDVTPGTHELPVGFMSRESVAPPYLLVQSQR